MSESTRSGEPSLRELYIRMRRKFDDENTGRCEEIRKLRAAIDVKFPDLEDLTSESERLNRQLEVLKELNSKFADLECDSELRANNEKIRYLKEQVSLELKNLESTNEEVSQAAQEVSIIKGKIMGDALEYDHKFQETKSRCDKRCGLLEIIPSVHKDGDELLSISFADTGTKDNIIAFRRDHRKIVALGTPLPIIADLDKKDDLKYFLIRIRKMFR